MRSVVKIQKKITMSVLAGGAEVTNTYASIEAFSSGIWFGDILRQHNDAADDFHFDDPHKVFCIGNVEPEAAGEEIFINLANMWGILNLARALDIGGRIGVNFSEKFDKFAKFASCKLFGIFSINVVNLLTKM